jgi:ABC-type transport system substrate-binding protein
MRQKAIGTGPFILTEWNKGTSVTLKSNPDYWDTGKPYLDEIRLLVIADYSTQQGQFIAGQVDMISQIEDPIQADGIKSQVKDAVAEQWTTRGLNWGYKLNGQDYLKDARTRQAIGAAYNRELAVKTVYGGAAKTSTPYPPAWVEAQPDWQVAAKDLGPTYTYDAKVARQLLQAAGTLGTKVSVAVTGAGHGPQSLANGTFMAENLSAAGFTAKVYDAPYAEFASRLAFNSDPNFDIMRAAAGTTWDIGDLYLTHVNYSVTGTGLNKRDFDPKLLDMAYKYRTLLKAEERKAQGFDIQKYNAQQAYYITTESNVYRDFWRPYVKNYRPVQIWSLGWGSRVFREVWIDKQA